MYIILIIYVYCIKMCSNIFKLRVDPPVELAQITEFQLKFVIVVVVSLLSSGARVSAPMTNDE